VANELHRRERIAIDAVANDVVVMPVGIDQVAHRFVGVTTDRGQHTAGGCIVGLRVYYYDVLGALDESRIRFDRIAGRIVTHDGEHVVLEFHDRKLVRCLSHARECKQQHADHVPHDSIVHEPHEILPEGKRRQDTS
jgi:hypothetical protein